VTICPFNSYFIIKILICRPADVPQASSSHQGFVSFNISNGRQSQNKNVCKGHINVLHILDTPENGPTTYVLVPRHSEDPARDDALLFLLDPCAKTKAVSPSIDGEKRCFEWCFKWEVALIVNFSCKKNLECRSTRSLDSSTF
jgi:hypothetical protein